MNGEKITIEKIENWRKKFISLVWNILGVEKRAALLSVKDHTDETEIEKKRNFGKCCKMGFFYKKP